MATLNTQTTHSNHTTKPIRARLCKWPQKKSVKLANRVVGIFIATLLRLLSPTYKVELIGFDTLTQSPLIFAIYHGDQLVLAPIAHTIPYRGGQV